MLHAAATVSVMPCVKRADASAQGVSSCWPAGPPTAGALGEDCGQGTGFFDTPVPCGTGCQVGNRNYRQRSRGWGTWHEGEEFV